MIWTLLIAAILQAAAPRSFRDLDKGDQSFVDDGRQVVARTAAEWNTLWRQHSPDRPQPQVDLAQDMVVGVFLGSRPTAGFALEIVGVEAAAGELVVRYRERRPGQGAITAQVITSPYHLVAVARQAGAVRFQRVE